MKVQGRPGCLATFLVWGISGFELLIAFLWWPTGCS